VKRRGNTAPHAQNYHTGIALVTIVAVTTWAPSWLQQPGGGQDHLAATAVLRPAFCPAGRAALQASVWSWHDHPQPSLEPQNCRPPDKPGIDVWQ
ncbi:MAG: hypothetical protein R5N60_07715, partial [Cutibacterium granulosum]|nr:hypothetical protein [Cutibacterium granulosum]